ncbi:hypothetical protein B0H34DRAFT_796365 [Crassisporium funariophilum]|nr:hypothetical protein B0H34DRAFT_796365 [Crassisporium funariophilum]
MKLGDRFASVLGFRAIPTTLLALLTYLSVFVALIVTNKLPNAPKNQRGLDLKQAYDDLRHITAHPHPYNSHANDAVRSYLLSRLQPLTRQYPFLHISNDLVSNGSWASSLYGVYFEGTNILVKIDGTSRSASGGILFSAHYDSVSTAPGATDDGMGVVTLLQLVQYFAENRPKRTAVFNINNGEEDWLNGAHAFLEHPWSDLTDTFLNLEGAAAGGRPILFRASSTSPVRSFRSNKLVPHPHANVLSSDAFARGLIRSGTDYSVYTGPRASRPDEEAGMQGLDLAFYKGRSRYHTKYDAAPYTSGGKKSLWSMMEVARGVGVGLLNTDEGENEGDDGGVPVYFDLFKAIIFVFPIINLLTFNVVALIVGPIVLIMLVLCERVITSRRKAQRLDVQDPPAPIASPRPQPRYSIRRARTPGTFHEEPHAQPQPVESSSKKWYHSAWRHAKFWIALLVTVALQALLIWRYAVLNPFAIYSSPYIVLFSFFTLAYLSLTFTLTLPSSLPFFAPELHHLATPLQDKHTVFLHLYFFTWILLVLSTLGITRLKPGVGSGYLMSAWNLCAALGCVLAAVERMFLFVRGRGKRARRRVRDDDADSGSDSDEEEDEVEDDHDPHYQANSSETTPLIHQTRSRAVKQGNEDESLATWWWIPQFLVSVPLPVILMSHVTTLLLDAMPQTLADGSPASSVYTLTSILSLLTVLPLAPFTNKLHRFRLLSTSVLILFVLSTVYAWLAFPFSSEAPLKVFFQQRVEIDLGLNTTITASGGPHLAYAPGKVITSLSGPSRYLPHSAIISGLPSASNTEVRCSPDPVKKGLELCEWESGFGKRPVPGGGSIRWDDDDEEYFSAAVRRTGPSSARISVKGRNTRACRVYFDSRPAAEYVVKAPEGSPPIKGMQRGYEVGEGGVKEVRLWSRTWGRQFVLDVEFGAKDNSSALTTLDMQGRIACEWAEYESGTVDHGSGVKGKNEPKIPAFEEVLTYLPEWAVVSKMADGLVEVWAPFAV